MKKGPWQEKKAQRINMNTSRYSSQILSFFWISQCNTQSLFSKFKSQNPVLRPKSGWGVECFLKCLTDNVSNSWKVPMIAIAENGISDRSFIIQRLIIVDQ